MEPPIHKKTEEREKGFLNFKNLLICGGFAVIATLIVYLYLKRLTGKFERQAETILQETGIPEDIDEESIEQKIEEIKKYLVRGNHLE